MTFLKCHHLRLWPSMIIGGCIALLIVLSFFSWRWYLYAKQGHVIAVIESQGARVAEYHNSESFLGVAMDFLHKPRYVRVVVVATQVDLSLADELPGLWSLYLEDTTLAEEDTRAISEMARLENLVMKHVQVPRSKCHLEALDNLKMLMLNDVDIKSVDVAEIAKARSLRTLFLDHCGVTDRELTHFKELPKLKEFSMQGSLVSSLGLRYLQYLPRLETLNLAGGRLTDKSLEALRDCKSLRELDVSDNPITDKGLKTLVEMKNLGCIKLNRTKITDAGLQVFESDPYNGRNLEVKGTAVTESGIAKLRDVSPVMTVIDDHGEHSLMTDENPRLPVPRLPSVAPPPRLRKMFEQ